MRSILGLSAELVLAGDRGVRSTDAELVALSDEQLMTLVALDRSQLAFSTLYNRHEGIAHAAAVRICGERALAEDAVQEAFLSMWRARLRYDSGRGSVRGWVLRIVHNRAIDVLRRGLRERGALFEPAIEGQPPELQRIDAEADLREQARTLRSALRGLPAEQSSVIELAYYGGYTQTEIATMFGVPIGTVKGRMRLGLQKLRAELTADRVLA